MPRRRRDAGKVSSFLREPGDRFAAYTAEAAPDVDVRVLRPGRSVHLALPRAERPSSRAVDVEGV